MDAMLTELYKEYFYTLNELEILNSEMSGLPNTPPIKFYILTTKRDLLHKFISIRTDQIKGDI